MKFNPTTGLLYGRTAEFSRDANDAQAFTKTICSRNRTKMYRSPKGKFFRDSLFMLYTELRRRRRPAMVLPSASTRLPLVKPVLTVSQHFKSNFLSFLVVTVDEVGIASLERIQFAFTQLGLILVFKELDTNGQRQELVRVRCLVRSSLCVDLPLHGTIYLARHFA